MSSNRGVNSIVAIGSLALGIAFGYFALKPNDRNHTVGPPGGAVGKNQSELELISQRIETKRVQLQQEPNVLEKKYLRSGREVVEFLAKAFANGDYPESEIREIRRQMRAKPELGFQLLELYPNLENRQVRDAVKHILAMANQTDHFFLERHIVQQIAQDTASIESWGLLAEWGVQTADGIEHFTDQLRFQSDPRKLQASSRALSKVSKMSSMQMDQSMVGEVIQRFNQLRDHHDEYVRAAAIASYDAFTPADIEQRLVAALDDPATVIRSSAMTVFANRLSSSNQVAVSLVRNMQNLELPPLERHLIARILMRSNASALDLNEVSRAFDEINASLAVYSQEELRVMRQSRRQELEPELR